ncbi:MAG: hypothetical protein LUQ36_10540 [Methanoregula sp.]|jgi:hypothetical protein|nr:hypothetical protein [Methanoregula sp.]
MGVKKKKDESTKLMSKIFIVCVCLLFVGLMVLSGMGTGWLTIFSSVKAGDTVVIDYTLFDAAGKPIVTTEKTIYDQALASGSGILGSTQISIVANQTIEKPIYPILVYPSNGGKAQQLALFSSEYNALSSGIVGMRVNEQKRIAISPNTSMTYDWSAERLALNKINLSEITVGDSFFMGVSDNPEAAANNSTANTFLRIGEVANKSPQGIVVNFSFPVIDVRVVTINK